MRTPTILATALLAACTAATGPGGRWTGEVTPKTPGPTCIQSRGTANVDGDHITFAPSEGTWILSGTAAPDGTITAEKMQLGANKLPYETRLIGKIAGDQLTGNYITPRCTFEVALKRRP